jgi:hypothetical protein
MVLVPMDQLLHTIEIRFLPFRIVTRVLGRSSKRQLLALLVVHLLGYVQRPSNCVVKSMAFQIGLVHDPQAELVCEIEQARMRGIVRAPQSVDIVRLHEEQVFLDEI